MVQDAVHRDNEPTQISTSNCYTYFQRKEIVSYINYHSSILSYLDHSRVNVMTSAGDTNQLYATGMYGCNCDTKDLIIGNIAFWTKTVG
jgi:hypothetical protein